MASRFWVGSTGTWDNSDTTHWAATSNGAGGQSVPGASDTVTFDANSGGGTVTPNYDMTVTSITMGAFTGTLDFSANNNSPTMATFSGTGTGTRTLNMGSGTWTLTGTGTIWNVGVSTNMTLDAGTSTIAVTTNTASSRTLTSTLILNLWDVNISAGSGNIQLTNFVARNINLTGQTGQLQNGQVRFYGNMTFDPGMSVVATGNPITFGELAAPFSSNDGTLTTNGVSLDRPFTVNKSGCKLTLADDLTIGSTRTLTLTNGTFDANDQDVTFGLFSSNNSNVRGLSMGSGTWTITGDDITLWNIGTTSGLSFDAGSSLLKFTGVLTANRVFSGGGLTYNNFWNATTGNFFLSMGGSNTFNDLRIDAGRTQKFTAGTTQTVTSFTVNGTAGNLITLSSASNGSSWYLSKLNGQVDCDYLSLQDSHAMGGAVFNAGNNSADVSNNEGWVFGNMWSNQAESSTSWANGNATPSTWTNENPTASTWTNQNKS